MKVQTLFSGLFLLMGAVAFSSCTASRYGDYFTGGPSVMYLDDLQLVY